MTHHTQSIMELARAVLRHAGSNAVSAALLVALFGAIAWLFIIWKEPLSVPAADRAYVKAAGAVAKSPAKPQIRRASSERDVFRPVLPKKIERPKKVKKAEPPPPPPPPVKPPPPRLALVGTIILDDREAAIIDYAGSGQKATYRVGDSIEGFVIREIRKDWVLLDREGEIMRVFMTQPPGTGGGRTQTQGYPRGGDIPPTLVPRAKGAPADKTP